MKKGTTLLLILFQALFAQVFASDTIHHNRLQVIPVPVLYYTPETRFAFGGGVSFTIQLHKDSSTNYSQIFFVAAYTQNRQIVAYFPFDFYSKDNDYYLDGEVGFYRYSYYYWGIGENRVPKELYAMRYPRLIANVYRKLTPHLYSGLAYNFEKDVILKTQLGGELSTGEVTGTLGCTVSGLGLDALYDTRDSIFFPTKGWYIKAVSYFNYPVFGSTVSFAKIITNVSYYKQICKPLILAFNQQNIFCFGDVPFNQLALLGGSKQMRGYYLGYYRDKFLSLFQAEARLHIYRRWGADFFWIYCIIRPSW